jgi:hypothetical protein
MKSENLELSISHGTICGGYGKKIKWGSNILSCTMLTNPNIFEEVSKSWDVWLNL